MPEQLLHGSNVMTVLEQVRRKRMPGARLPARQIRFVLSTDAFRVTYAGDSVPSAVNGA